MRRLLLVSPVFLALACDTPSGSSSATPSEAKSSKNEAAAAPPPPVSLSLEERIKVHDQCFVDWTKEDASLFSRCYADASSETLQDSGDAPSTGIEGAKTFTKALWDGFSLGGEPRLTLASGEEVLNVYAIWGTHDGRFHDTDPTQKKMGLLGAELQALLPDGKHGQVRLYMDPGTILSQIGAQKGQVRKPLEAGGVERKLVIGAGGEVESANLLAVGKWLEAWNAHDTKALGAAYGAKATVYDQTAVKDVVGAKAIAAAAKARYKGFSDLKATADKTWAAGDYVVCELTVTGTNDGTWNAGGVPKKTGKPATLHEAHVYRLAEGKIEEEWVFANQLALRGQLGLLPAPKPAPAAKPEEAAATPATTAATEAPSTAAAPTPAAPPPAAAAPAASPPPPPPAAAPAASPPPPPPAAPPAASPPPPPPKAG